MRHRQVIAACAAFALFAICTTAKAADDRPCILAEAVAATAAAEFQGEEAFSTATLAELRTISAINDKAKLPNVPIKDQLSAADIRSFNAARAQMIRISMTRSAVSRNTRNVRLIEGLSYYTEILDLDHFDPSSVAKDDPRYFYFTVIYALREVQPNPPETTLPDPKNGCTMEAALSLLEHFNMQQMASQPTNKGVLDFIEDTRRLEQFLSVMRKSSELDQIDAANIHVDANGAPTKLEDSFTKWLQTQPSSSQKIGNTILQAVDRVLPSKSHYELDNQVAQTAQINAEYPAR
jgi:hypothetical protein